MSRTIAILKKISLAGLADNWDENSFIIAKPVSYKDYQEYTDLDVKAMDEKAGVKLMIDMVKSHFVSGKLPILADSGEVTIEDAEKDDIENLGVEMLSKLFSEIMGVNYDPKAIQTAAQANKIASTSENSIETSSSETVPVE
jgi:hypothetical protein